MAVVFKLYRINNITKNLSYYILMNKPNKSINY